MITILCIPLIELSRLSASAFSNFSTLRQRDQWSKQVVADLRDGRALQALNELDNRGLLNFSENTESAKNALVEKWGNYRKSQPNKQSLLLAHKWADVMDLNAKAREVLQAEGYLPTEQVEIKCAISNKVFTQQFAIGERIRLTKNDYKMGLTNGDLGTITDIITSQNEEILFEVFLDSGKHVNINTSSYCSAEGNCHIAQAYAMTVYSSQGLTIDGDTFIYYTSGMDRANSYVAGSRHKDNSHWFFNDKETLFLKEHTGDLENHNEQKMKLRIISNLMSTERNKEMALEHLSSATRNQTRELSLEQA